MSGGAGANKPQVTICGLGPGGPNRITEQTAAVLAGEHRVFLRTARHPGVSRFSGFVSFDHLYETAESFEEVYRSITETVTDAAEADGHVVYAVPGSPLILERSVRYLRASDRVDVAVLPAVSFLDEVWAVLGVDPVEQSVRLVDGLAFTTDAASERGPLLVAHTHSNWVLSDIKLALDAGPEQRVVVMQRLGTEDEQVFEVGWPDLDREVEADHLTTLYIPELAVPVGRELAASVEMMSRLRSDCPWDREQTHRSLRKYLIEEAYEVLDAIDGLEDGSSTDGADLGRYADLEEELGDLWFQILFHAELAAEAGQFTIADVAAGLREKMVRRHPHVYGERGGRPPTSEPEQADLITSWERLKLEEKGRGSILDGIPTSLPALALAEKTLKKIDGAGSPAAFSNLDVDVVSAFAAESDTDMDGDVDAERIGLFLLRTVELARKRGINAEQALRTATQRAGARYRAAERDGREDPDWVAG